MDNSIENNITSYSSNIRTFEELEQISTEGEKSNGWYILLEGKIGVIKHDRQVAELSRRGVVFGELSFILNTPQTVSLVALETTKAVHFDMPLDQLITEYPDVTKKVLINLAERLAKTTEDYISFVEKDIKPL
ncbi:MAG: cyclic nucleotide-binding domain-containing protein [Ignavibacteriales bacterium]|nr:cyclic nucleotide-binding domain-containing protein [Ignavibacteriales bacterium]